MELQSAAIATLIASEPPDRREAEDDDETERRFLDHVYDPEQ